MKAIVQRDVSNKVTFGKMILPWLKVQPDIYTLELPWLDNQPEISCIPAGSYILKPFNSPKHGSIWRFQNVPDRFNCEIHAANFACDVIFQGDVYHSELKGCMAVGFAIDENIPMLQNSKAAMDYLRTTIGINTIWEMEIRDA